MGAAEPDGVFPRTVTHFGGTTTIAALPQRVVVIATGQTAASQDIYPTLAEIAPTVLVEGTGVNWKQDFLMLAKRYIRLAYPVPAESAAEPPAEPRP